MSQDTNTSFENRPWPDPELDSVSPWPPARIPQRTRPRLLTGKAAIAGVLLGGAAGIFLTAFGFFLTAW